MHERAHLSIAGIPVRVEWSFWLIAVLLGIQGRDGWLLVAWVVIVFVSVLVHELGHGVALRLYRQRPRIVLQAFGGLTYGSAPNRSRAMSIVVSAAGPLSALVLLGWPAYVLYNGDWSTESFERFVIVHDVMWVNIGWSVVNLLPILPLDGGNIAASIVGPRRARIVSMVVAAAAATYFFQQHNQFAGFFLMMFALMNFGAYQQEKTGSGAALPPQAQPPPPRTLSLAVPPAAPRPDSDGREQLEGLAWNALRNNDVLGARRVLARHPAPERVSPFLWGSLALAEGRNREGIEAFVAGYDAQPGGPASLVPATVLARSGQSAALAQRLLAGTGTAPQATSALQNHLHYADCFGESAAVGALLYEDGRANRAQSAFEVGCSLARTGDAAGALTWIERAIDAGFTAGALLDGEPDLAPVRGLAAWPGVRARVT